MMKEIRSCAICHFGKFAARPTSLRKTCSTVCSRIYTANYKKRYSTNPEVIKRVKLKRQTPQFIARREAYEATPEYQINASKGYKKWYNKVKDTVRWRAKSKAANKKYYDKNKDDPEWKAKIKAANKKWLDKVKDTAEYKSRTKAANKKHYDKIKNTPKWRAKAKAANKKYYDKNKDTPKWKAKKYTKSQKKKMRMTNNERD